MHLPHRTFLAVLVLGLLTALHLPERAEAGVTVQDRDLVSKRRAGRGSYDYTYTLTIDNVGTTLDDVKVYVTCDAPGTTIIDETPDADAVGVVEFGDIPENAQVTSTDTFTLRQNRRIPFDPECLVYEVGFDTVIRLTGTATDQPLANAIIIGTVVRPDSGRPIIDSGRPIIDTFTATADEDGNYELELVAVTEDDFITLEAQGTGEQEGAVLTSTVGSVGTLQEVGESGSIVVDSGDFGSLNITHITTAQDELVRRLNGGVPPANDAELAALQAQVDGAELIVLATLIKTIVDNPNIPLPPGFDSTLDLIQDEGAAEQAIEDLSSTPEFQEALVTTAETLGLGYSPDEVIGRLYAVIAPERPLGGSASYEFDFDPNGGGNLVFDNGSTSFTWLINSAGEIEVTPTTPFLLFESFPSLPECSNNPTGQCRQLTFLDAIRIVRLSDGLETDQVFVLSTTRATYPDDPLPDEVFEGVPNPDAVFLAFGDDGIIPVDPADISGSRIALYYFHQDNNTVGLSNNSEFLGADFLTFNSDGTGSTQRRSFSFNWSIDAVGAVEVDFSNGDSNRFVLYVDDEVSQAISIGSLATGEAFTTAGEVIEFTGTEFSNNNVPNQRYRGLFSIVEDFGFLFDFVFLPDGTGCRLDTQPLTWELTSGNILDTLLFRDATSSEVFQRRAWELIRVTSGIQGDRYYVIEMLDINFISDPLYEFADPATTPGRINAYENVEDLTGQFDPCGSATSTSQTTLFDSNNGGVGNLFDVTTLGDAIEVTAFDVNVDLPVGTDFEISVYTTPGGFANGYTPNIPGCLINCIDVSAWSLIATGTGTAAGLDLASRVDVPPFLLDGGTTTGIWITLARDGSITDEFRYTNGAGSVSDANITISVGAGVAAPDPTTGLESVFLDRAWNGTIYYNFR